MIADKAMDFLGLATWSARETCTATVGTTAGTCSGSGTIATTLLGFLPAPGGLGVAIFSPEPLPVGFRTLPLLWEPNPTAAGVMAQINTAIANAQTQVGTQLNELFANPQVAMLLETIFGSVPEVPETPAVP